MNVRGVIQVGAHKGQEVKDYKTKGIYDIVLIEPGEDAYLELIARYANTPGIILFNTACGDGKECEYVDAYVEHSNQGMSSSLLEPKVHLKQHPDVIFDGTVKWLVTPLDRLPFDRRKYNMLNMDVQGYELHVLKGATDTLEHIDYIYSEVNRQEMYAGCAMVDELQEYLRDFKLVEIGWASDYHGWGDGFFVRKTLLNE